MKMPNDPDIPAEQAEQGHGTRLRGLWPWFAAGFLVVFVGMLLFVRMLSMHPSGEFLVSCSLWRYYAIEIPRALKPFHNIGPADGSNSGLLSTAFQHVLCSVVGGVIVLGFGWGVRKMGKRLSRGPD